MTSDSATPDTLSPPPSPPGETPRKEGSTLARAWARWPGSLLRVLIAVLPLAWVSQHVQWRLVASRATQVGAPALLMATAAGFSTLLIGALRWRFMLRAYDADPAKLPSVLTLLRHNMVGQYFAMLPTGVAGEALRGYRVSSCFREPATSYVVLFVERLLGLLGLLAVAGMAALFSPEVRGGPVAYAMNVGMLLAFGAGVVALALPHLAVRWPSFGAMVHSIPIAGAVLRRVPPARRMTPLVIALVLSIVSQLFAVLSIAVLLTPLAPTATLIACARVVPPIILITYIPLTPGGFGQREAAFVHFFALVGVESEAAVAASLLYFGVLLATSIAGGLVLLYERARGLG